MEIPGTEYSHTPGYRWIEADVKMTSSQYVVHVWEENPKSHCDSSLKREYLNLSLTANMAVHATLKFEV